MPRKDKDLRQSRLTYSDINHQFDNQKSDMNLSHFFDVCSALKPCTLVANSCSTLPEWIMPAKRITLLVLAEK